MSMFFGADRALAVRGPAIPLVAGAPALVPLKLQGREGINSLFEYRLVLQTPDAYHFKASEGSNFDLDAFVGRELTCAIELESHGSFVPGVPGGLGAHQGAGEREISGLVTQARFIGESSRHALYELTLRPWLHLATLTTDCRVYQDQSPVEIIEDVLGRYAFAADKRLIETYPRMDYTVQYNESDFEFVTRLMQAWGINYHFEHSGGVHRLVWSDHNGAFQVTQKDQGKGLSAYHRIPFYPLGHKIDREYIHGFSPTDALTSGSYASRDYDHTRPRATLEARAESPRPTGHANQAVYLWRGDRAGIGGSDYSQPNRGADKAAHRTEAQGEHLARLRMQVLRQGGRRATGVGHLRGIVAGCTFALTGHPRERANAEYVVLDARTLHLMVVMPLPEDEGMIPRTYDTFKSLGQGQSMQNQRDVYAGEERTLAAQQAWDARHAALSPQEKASGRAVLGRLGPRPSVLLSPVTQDAQKVKEPTLDKDGVLMQDGKSLGLKVLVCKMATPNQTGQAALGASRDIYIHSKLLMIDDCFMTLGSANLNLRSMSADSEINLATDSIGHVRSFRRRVWGMQTGGEYDGGDGLPHTVSDTFGKWKKLAAKNKEAIHKAKTFAGFLVQFEDTRTAMHRYG